MSDWEKEFEALREELLEEEEEVLEEEEEVLEEEEEVLEEEEEVLEETEVMTAPEGETVQMVAEPVKRQTVERPPQTVVKWKLIRKEKDPKVLKYMGKVRKY